jgi:UDP-glucuronate 4-epimerase
MKQILVTGAAGFIGFFVARRLLMEGHGVFGIDNLNDYYEVALKQDRLTLLKEQPNFAFAPIDLTDRQAMANLFRNQPFDTVIHLAAQAGVRYSLENPFAYCDSNLNGFLTVLEGCRYSEITHLIFASSSSVYGTNPKVPFAVADNVNHPISLYAATKKANELMAHAYSHLYGIPTTGLRFFTVYGPWGRPDMVYFKFVDAIAQDRPIQVFNYGKMKRDFTYIDDVVEAIVRLIDLPPTPSDGGASCVSSAPYKLYNIGNHNPVELLTFIEIIEAALGKPAAKIFLPMQPGDMPIIYADVEDLVQRVGVRPDTPIEVGMHHFIAWYQERYGI